jgi:O-antigen/teichoic acid export membrane protein
MIPTQIPNAEQLYRKSLAAASLASLKWEYAGTAARALSSTAVSIVLARVLGPEPFGLVAVGWLVIGVSNLIADLGLGSALLQRRTISNDDIRYAFNMQVWVGVALMGITALFAPLVGRIFNEMKVVPVIRVMSLVFLLQTLGGISVCLLKRQMNFKNVQFAQISSYLAGFVGIGIPLALIGFGVWSLVLAQLSQTALFSVLCYLQVQHPVKIFFRFPSSALTNFGIKVLFTNIVNYFISNAATFLIGRCFDVITLGLYNRVYTLVSTPMNSVVAAVQQVTFAAYSRMQDNTSKIRNGYLAGIGFMTILMLPIFGCVALIPRTVIYGLFGNQWEAAIPFVMPLALAMPFHAVMATGGPMLWASNQVGREFVAQLWTVCCLLIVLVATSKISAVMLAWGVFGVTIVRFIFITHASLKTVGAPWKSLLVPSFGGMFLLIVTGSMTYLSDQLLQTLEVGASHRLILDATGSCILFGATIFSVPRLMFSSEMCWLAARLIELVPAWTRPLLKRIAYSPAVVV